MSSDARAIYQRVLDLLTEAILSEDGMTWERHMMVPHFMSTCDGKLVHETREDLLLGLKDFAGALRRLGVTTLDRRCDTARRTDEDVIVGYHTTRMATGDGTAYPAYPVRWVLHRQDGAWKVAKSDSALSATDWDDIPHNRLSQFDAVGGDATKARRMLMQLLVDRIDSVYMSGDFDGWRDSVCLPLVFETRSGQGVFETEDQLRADFELYQQEFAIHRVTELARVVRSAEVIDDDVMLGTYRVHVLSGTRYVVPPWNAAATLRRVDGRWRLTKTMNALGHLNWTSNACRPADDDAGQAEPLN